MRVKSPSLPSVFTSLGLCIMLLMSACSNNSTANSASKKIHSDRQVSASSTKPATKSSPKASKHVHPSNPCTAALAHSHLFESKDHKHSYDCENTNDFVSNAHVHPATKTVRKYRHVHPNGANKHSHQR